MKKPIQTQNAPAAIGTYSQAIQAGQQVYISGQIPLVSDTMEMVEGDFNAQVRQVCQNLKAVAEAAGASLDDIVKISVFLLDLSHFQAVNEAMAEFFSEPFPARAAVQVAALPKGALVEMDAILHLP